MYNVYTHVFLSPLPFFPFFVFPFSFSFPAPSSPLFLPNSPGTEPGRKGSQGKTTVLGLFHLPPCLLLCPSYLDPPLTLSLISVPLGVRQAVTSVPCPPPCVPGHPLLFCLRKGAGWC